MQCPYCKKEMVSGSLLGDEYRLKWLPEDKKLLLGIWATGAVPIGSGGTLTRANVPAYFCKDCHKIIFNQKD